MDEDDEVEKGGRALIRRRFHQANAPKTRTEQPTTQFSLAFIQHFPQKGRRRLPTNAFRLRFAGEGTFR